MPSSATNVTASNPHVPQNPHAPNNTQHTPATQPQGVANTCSPFAAGYANALNQPALNQPAAKEERVALACHEEDAQPDPKRASWAASPASKSKAALSKLQNGVQNDAQNGVHAAGSLPSTTKLSLVNEGVNGDSSKGGQPAGVANGCVVIGEGGEPGTDGAGTVGQQLLEDLKRRREGKEVEEKPKGLNPLAASLSFSEEDKFKPAPPVRRYRLGPANERMAKDMQFVAKVGGWVWS